MSRRGAALPRLEDEVDGAWMPGGGGDDQRRERERLLPPSSSPASQHGGGLLNLRRKKPIPGATSTQSPSSASSTQSQSQSQSSLSSLVWGAEVRVEDLKAWWWPVKLPFVAGPGDAQPGGCDGRGQDTHGDDTDDEEGRRRWLLRGIKARAQPGRLLAILGPSGTHTHMCA
jgi:hypothetical protein